MTELSLGFFFYDSACYKSKWIIVISDGNICGALIKGKSPTDLKVHWIISHNEANASFTNSVCWPGYDSEVVRMFNYFL